MIHIEGLPPQKFDKHWKKVSMFDGKMDPNELMDWLKCVEYFFDLKECRGYRCVKYVATKLEGYALVWWNQLVHDRPTNDLDPITS